jgi:hypothetical protein
MIKKSQIKEVLLKYIVPLQKQYPDFYLGGSIALMLQKHIPFRDTKDIDIVSPAFFGDLHETKFPYKGMVTSKKTYRIREINTCLDFFHNPQAQYVVATFQGHNIKLSPVNEITYAKENKIWGPVYKKKQSELGKEISKIFNEAIIKPGNTGVTAPLTSEEKKWIANLFAFFESYESPEGDANTPLVYTFMNREYIEEMIEEEEMTSEDLKNFDSVYRKLRGNKVYTFNNKRDDQVDNYPNLRDSVIKADTHKGKQVLTLTYSDADWDDNEEYFGAFDKNTGKYIKYSDLNEAIIKPGNTGLKNKRLKATFYSSPTTNVDRSTPGTQIGLLKIDKIPGANKTPAKITYYNSKENYITFNLNTDDEMLWTQAFKEQKIPYKITNSNKLRINNVSNYIDITKGSSIHINR